MKTETWFQAHLDDYRDALAGDASAEYVAAQLSELQELAALLIGETMGPAQ